MNFIFMTLCQDQVLLNMQQKLDSLCELVVNNSKEHSTNKSCDKDGELQLNETLGAGKINFIDCGCWHCEQHSGFFNELMVRILVVAFCWCCAIMMMLYFHNVSVHLALVTR